MSVYKVTLGMASPVIPPEQGVIMGDALLFAAETRYRFGDDARQRQPSEWEPITLPVRQITGNDYAFYAVSGILVEPWQQRVCGELKPVSWQQAKTENLMFTRHSDDRVFSGNQIGSGKFRGLLTNMDAYFIPRLHFYAEVPDEQYEHFAELVDTLRELYVGKKGNRGFGQICEVTVELTDRESAILHDGKWLRPVPVEYGESIADGYRMALPIEPPYFYAPSVVTLVSFLDPIGEEKTSRAEEKTANNESEGILVETVAP